MKYRQIEKYDTLKSGDVWLECHGLTIVTKNGYIELDNKDSNIAVRQSNFLKHNETLHRERPKVFRKYLSNKEE